MAGVILITSIGSLFYRSATLYHPQRRAILHLKSQRRKVLEIGPGGSGTEDVRKLKCYKNCSLHATFASAFIASFGISLPVVHLVRYNYLYTIYVWLGTIFIRVYSRFAVMAIILFYRFNMHLTIDLSHIKDWRWAVLPTFKLLLACRGYWDAWCSVLWW